MLSGEDGLAAAMTNNYDLILLDLLNTWDVWHRSPPQTTRRSKASVRSKIIITTNLDHDEENRADVEKLADGYLIKAEMTPRQLVEIVDSFFGKQPEQKPA